MDNALAQRLDGLLGTVTTLSPSNLADWQELQAVLDRVRDEGFATSVAEMAAAFLEWGIEESDIPELRRRLRQTFGWH